jgi:hypothetical protein
MMNVFYKAVQSSLSFASFLSVSAAKGVLPELYFVFCTPILIS